MPGVAVIVWSDKLWDMTEEEKQMSEDATLSRTRQRTQSKGKNTRLSITFLIEKLS